MSCPTELSETSPRQVIDKISDAKKNAARKRSNQEPTRIAGHGEAPHLADSLRRYCGISCGAQAVDAPGAGSGWRHSRLIWALFAVTHQHLL